MKLSSKYTMVTQVVFHWRRIAPFLLGSICTFFAVFGAYIASKHSQYNGLCAPVDFDRKDISDLNNAVLSIGMTMFVNWLICASTMPAIIHNVTLYVFIVTIVSSLPTVMGSVCGLTSLDQQCVLIDHGFLWIYLVSILPTAIGPIILAFLSIGWCIYQLLSVFHRALISCFVAYNCFFCELRTIDEETLPM